MIQERELVAALLGVGVAAFVMINAQSLLRLPRARLLIASFGLALLSWVMSVVEDFLLHDALNVVEHVSISTSTVLLCLWVAMSRGREEAPP